MSQTSSQVLNGVDSPAPTDRVHQALSAQGFESTDLKVLITPMSTESIEGPSDRSGIATDDHFIITEAHQPEKGARGLEATGPSNTAPCHCRGMAVPDCPTSPVSIGWSCICL